MINVALDNQILRGVVGSTVHGLAIEGQDDRDEMGIFIEPPKYVLALDSFEHYSQRDQPEGVRSQPGDLDLILYSLRKFCRLASQGNPSITLLLWLPDYLIKTPLGAELINIRHAFISKDAGKRYLGYLMAQKAKLNGERSPKVSRPELIEQYGYDTKFAMHALRLGYQGIELLRTNNLTLPIKEPQRTVLRDMRTGKLTFEQTMDLIYQTECDLKTLIDNCKTKIDHKAIESFMIKAHKEWWKFPT